MPLPCSKQKWKGSEVIKLKVKKLRPGVMLPEYATDGSACFDIRTEDGGHVPSGSFQLFGTGLAFEVPPGHVMYVYSRSNHGFKHGVRLANGTGIIDSDYRGELFVALRNDSRAGFDVHKGDRIAQALIVPIQHVELLEADELSETERGAGGIGSTGR